MAARKKKPKRKLKLVPRRGPATNLRPAGAHKEKTKYDRRKQHEDDLLDEWEDGH